MKYYTIQVNLTRDEYRNKKVADLLENAGFSDLVWVGSTGEPESTMLGAVKFRVTGNDENIVFLSLTHPNFYHQIV